MNHKRSGSIHKIRELQLQTISLGEEYDIQRLLGEGTYGKVHLAFHKPTCCKVAIKCVPKENTKLKDFLREFHYSYFLSPHCSILISYDVAFQTCSSYVFAQEFAPAGDLASVIRDSGASGMDEGKVKAVAKQISSALDFMHSKQLVHRDIKPQNVLVFNTEVTSFHVKLTDFGLTKRVGTLVKKRNGPYLPYLPPEICEAVFNEGYHVETSSDVWQLAVLVFCCLTSSLPWERADIIDSNYMDFVQWQKRKTTKIPRQMKSFFPRLQRLFRRILDPKAEKRAPAKEVFKYLEDKWLLPKANDRSPSKDRGSESSQKSRRSSHDHKASLGQLLLSYGVEIKIDRDSKRKRVHEWILSAST